jgi:hypothetical protein
MISLRAIPSKRPLLPSRTLLAAHGKSKDSAKNQKKSSAQDYFDRGSIAEAAAPTRQSAGKP